MKYIIIVFMLIGAVAFSQVDFEYKLEAGYMPTDRILTDNVVSDFDGSMYMLFDANIILLDVLFVGGNMRNHFFLRDVEAVDFVPYFISFQYRFGLRFGGIEIGFRHTCLHPVISQYQNLSTIQGGGYEEIYIQFTGKVNLFGGEK